MSFDLAWDDYEKGACIPGGAWRLLCIGELFDNDGVQRLKGLILKPVVGTGEASVKLYKRVGYWSSYADEEREDGATIRTFESVGQRRLTLV